MLSRGPGAVDISGGTTLISVWSYFPALPGEQGALQTDNPGFLFLPRAFETDAGRRRIRPAVVYFGLALLKP